jgi:hypothetical protein
MYMNLTANDLVLQKKGGRIISGGYTVNSILMQNNIPAIQTLNHPNHKNITGGNLKKGTKGIKNGKIATHSHKVNHMFNNLAVPAGLLLLQQNTNTNIPLYDTKNTNEAINNKLYDSLLKLVVPNKRKLYANKTRKKRGGRRNKTRKI